MCRMLGVHLVAVFLLAGVAPAEDGGTSPASEIRAKPPEQADVGGSAEDRSPWNTLEIAKLIVSGLTPLAVALVGLWLNRHLKRFEHLQWASQKVIEKRIAVYARLAPVLNDLYCYFDYTGDWRLRDPDAAMGLKRKADKLFFVNAPLFSEAFRKEYQSFIGLCFLPGPPEEFDTTAKMRTDVVRRKELAAKAGQPWKPEWDRYFSPAIAVTPRPEIRKGYWRMMGEFARELGVGLKQEQ